MGLLDDFVRNLGVDEPAAAQPQSRELIDGVLEMLTSSEGGGLAGFAKLFEKQGLGALVSSWIGTGQNEPIASGDLARALGSERISALAARGGIAPSDAAALLARIVPALIDKLTPAGRAPAQTDLASLFGATRTGGAQMAGDKPRADFSNVKAGGSSTAPAPAAPAAQTYTVAAGDSLSKIAKKVYGDANKWRKIFEANQDQIKNPDLIHPGQVLKIPAA
jgi:uncharacterized protein YidB (DUF937 family)